MKAGFWMGPDGADGDLVIKPVAGPENPLASPAANPLSFLATADGAELVARCGAAAELLDRARAALAQVAEQGGITQFDLSILGDDDRLLVDQVLGTGEVTAEAYLADQSTATARESTLAGLWRVQVTDAAGRMTQDILEVGAIPDVVVGAAHDGTRAGLEIGEAPEGAMNGLPVLAEIRDRAAAAEANMAAGKPNHVISFTLLPMNEADMAFLQFSLGDGPVSILSKGYGTCRILATGLRNVWSVQYMNAMDTVILDSLEIGGVPSAALAAAEDFTDSAERLGEILEAYFQ